MRWSHMHVFDLILGLLFLFMFLAPCLVAWSIDLDQEDQM